MNNKELIDKVKEICHLVSEDAKNKLKEAAMPHTDHQYLIGRKHAAQDILHNISLIYWREDEDKKE